MPDACQRYHDHVASIYDDIYGHSPYWDFYHEVSWDHMKPFLPRDLSVEVHDVGCGTGIYGIRLLKAGFRVLFSDISPKMLDAARRNVEKAGFSEKAEFLRFSVSEMAAVANGRFALICAQGDPVSLCPDPGAAFREIGRTLSPGGVAILSVDHRAAGYEHFLEKADLPGLLKFHRDGMLTWLAKKESERFPFHTLGRKELLRFARMAGLQLESLIGKCVLPVRKHPELLGDGKSFRALVKIEKKLRDRETYLGRASHLQGAFRKP
jgi:SAM-dependent methyltransferase